MRRGSGGFTVLELLAVMTILAILFGLTAGALSRAGKAGVLDGSARVVRSALSRARGLAIAGSALSKVVVIPPTASEDARVRTVVSRIAGSWHFDGESDPGVGGDGVDLRLIGASVGPGFVRSGLVATPFSAAQTPPITRAARLDPRLGFSLELRIRPSGPGTIARFGGGEGDMQAFALRLNDNGSLSAEASVRAENPSLAIETRPGVIEMGQWAKVSIAHDGIEFSVAAHNVIEARQADLHEIDAERSAALVIGGFAGVIDDVVYRTAGELDPFDIDPQVNVKLTYPLTIRFNVDGRLHDRFHEAPVSIPIEHEGRTVTVTVDLAGIIR